MTDRERLVVGLAVSLAVHWLVMHVALPQPAGGEEMVFVADLTPPQAAVSLAVPLTLESLAPEPTPQEQARDAEARRLLARRQYLDRVVRAVHDRRMVVPAAEDLAGNVLVSLHHRRPGAVRGRRGLVRGSDDPDMDADALQAVRAASGMVPRPEILGSGAIPVTMAVKYQFGLQ